MTNEELQTIKQMLASEDKETSNLGLIMLYASLEDFEFNLITTVNDLVSSSSGINPDPNLKLVDDLLEEPTPENLVLAMKIIYLLFDNPYTISFFRNDESIYKSKINKEITEENKDKILKLLPEKVKTWWKYQTQNFFENE